MQHPLLLAAVSAVLPVLALPGLRGPLLLDSVKLYALGAVVDQYGHWAVLHTPGFNGGLNRIVAMASFVLDVQWADGVSPLRFKATNLGIHIATAYLAWLWLRLLVRATPYRDKAEAIALMTTALWLLSPANLNVLLYAIQRMTMLSALFVVAGLYFYTAGRLQQERNRRWLQIGTSFIVCLPLAVLSKENGILLLPLALLVEIYVLHPAKPWFRMRRLLVVAAAGTVIAIVLAVVLMPQVFDYGSRNFTLPERLLSQPRALVSYVWQLLVPSGTDTGVYTDGFRTSTGLLTPVSTLIALLSCAAGVGLSVILRRSRFALAGFGLAFFFVGHALESSVIPLDLYFMHRNYLPGIGLYLAVSAALAVLFRGRYPAALATTVLCIFFAVVSALRAETWSSRETIAMAAVRYNPESARAWSNFAQLATESTQYGLAENAVDRAIALSGTPNDRVQRLFVLCKAGREIQSEEYTRLPDSRQFGVANELSQALSNLLQLFQRRECPNLNVPAFTEALDALAVRYARAGHDPWTVQYYADSFLYADNERERAYARLQDRLDAGHIESGLVLVEWLIDDRDAARGRQVLRQVRATVTARGQHDFDDTLHDLERRLARQP